MTKARRYPHNLPAMYWPKDVTTYVHESDLGTIDVGVLHRGRSFVAVIVNRDGEPTGGAWRHADRSEAVKAVLLETGKDTVGWSVANPLGFSPIAVREAFPKETAGMDEATLARLMDDAYYNAQQTAFELKAKDPEAWVYLFRTDMAYQFDAMGGE